MKRQCKFFLNELGERNYRWFDELLCLVRSGWDEGYAREIINRYIGIDYLQTSMALLHKSRFKFVSALEAINKDYVLNIPF